MSLTTSDFKAVHLDTSNHSELPPDYEPATSSSNPLLAQDTLILSLPLAFPDSDAAAPEVRTYIRSFLHHKATRYGLTNADIIRVSGAWRFGTGEELRSYDQSTWQGLFGVELGMVLRKQVQEEIAKEFQQKLDTNYTANIIFMVFGLALPTLTLPLCFMDFDGDDDERQAMWGVWLVLFLGMGSIMFGIATANLVMKRRRNRETTMARSNGKYMRLNGDEENAISLQITN